MPATSAREAHQHGLGDKKDRAATRSSAHERRQRRTRIAACSLAGPGTESQAGAVVCAHRQLGLSAIASVTFGAGDGLQPDRNPNRTLSEIAVSHAAIAGVLARNDLSAGERLVALSLATFANREQLAWPGISAAAARAGLGRSRYLGAREQLVRRGLVVVEDAGTDADRPAQSGSCSRSPGRGGTATSTRSWWRRSSASPAPVDLHASCWLRSQRFPTRPASSRASPRTSSAVRRAWRTAPTGALEDHCSRRARSRSPATAEGVDGPASGRSPTPRSAGLRTVRRAWPEESAGTERPSPRGYGPFRGLRRNEPASAAHGTAADARLSDADRRRARGRASPGAGRSQRVRP